MHIFDHIYQYFVISLAYLFIYTRWFTVTFSSPSWRSLNPLKGSLNHPKKGTLNHQVYIPSLTALRHNVFPRFFAPKWHIHGANQRPRHPKAPPRRSPTAHQRTVDGWPRFPPPTKKKTKEREHETKKHVKNLDLDFGVDFFYIFCWMLSWNQYHFFLVWMAIVRLFLWTAKYCWKICNFPLSTFMPPKKSPSPWPFDLSAAASCPGHFYPADDVAHVSATMKPKTCHSSFILLPKGKILIIMNLYFYWLV